MKFAIISTGGKQYLVQEGQELVVEKIEAQPKDKITFDQVLLTREDKKINLGQPLVKNALVEAEILSQEKGKKIRVATYKAKSRYRRVKGHRQRLTRVKILRILFREKKSKTNPKSG